MSGPRVTIRCTLVLATVIFVAAVAGCGSDTQPTIVQPSPTDQAPPLPPSGLAVQILSGTKCQLTWTPNLEPDLDGYRLYTQDPSLEGSGGYRLISGAALIRGAGFSVAGARGATYTFSLTAVDLTGNESAMSESLVLTFRDGTTEPTDRGQQEENPGDGDGATGGSHDQPAEGHGPFVR